MLNAWKQADNFNKVVPIGTTILYDDKEHKTADHAYVLASGEPVVLLHKISCPISLSKISIAMDEQFHNLFATAVENRTVVFSEGFHSLVPLTDPFQIPFTS